MRLVEKLAVKFLPRARLRGAANAVTGVTLEEGVTVTGATLGEGVSSMSTGVALDEGVSNLVDLRVG